MRPSDAYLARFEALHPKKIDLTLGRTLRLLEKLGHPERRLAPVIHVAGTNGKGSTVAFCRAILEAAGQVVHVYTTPHLVRFHERIRLGAPGGGRFVGEDRLVATFEKVEKVNDGEPISFFEITTCAAIELFASEPADAVLMEVGLGGRFDATNVFDRPAAAVVTPVSMDHREHLGDTVAKIAREKAGIFKRGAPAVIAPQDEEQREVLVRLAEEAGAELFVGGQDFSAHEEHGRFVYQDRDRLIDLPLPRLAGRHQHINAATAIAALRASIGRNLSNAVFEAGMETVTWPARLQRLTGRIAARAPAGAELWLDGGHNAEGARVAAEAMADFEEKSPRPLVLLMGMMARKPTLELVEPFRGLARELYAVPIHAGGSRPAEEIAAVARDLAIPAALAGSVSETLRFLAARDWPVPPRILIIGSLYLAGEVLEADGALPV